jgi:hypothetical protein
VGAEFGETHDDQVSPFYFLGRRLLLILLTGTVSITFERYWAIRLISTLSSQTQLSDSRKSRKKRPSFEQRVPLVKPAAPKEKCHRSTRSTLNAESRKIPPSLLIPIIIPSLTAFPSSPRQNRHDQAPPSRPHHSFSHKEREHRAMAEGVEDSKRIEQT